MLKFLHIENIAVIERSDIEFTSGLNVLTGETGAGKSIIIDSINAILGHRTSKELIREGCDSALVTAVFDDVNENVLSILSENGITPDEEGNLLITRKLSNTGKGLIKINGIPVTASVLKDVGALLINIHGQHDNQALLNPDEHINYVDAMADNSEVVDEYYNVFKNLNAIRRELNSLQLDEDEKAREINLLNYQINEIESANIKVGEKEILKKKLEISKNYEKTYAALSAAYNSLKGNDDKDGAVALLFSAIKGLNSLKNDEYNENSQKLSNAIQLVEDVASDMADFIYNSEFSENDADIINDRLDLLDRLMLKYGSTEEEIIDFLNKASQRLESISLSEKRIEALSKDLDAATDLLIDSGEKLTNSRIKTAKDFEEKVCEILSFLNMPNVEFKVDINKGRYTKRGCDVVEFLISANAGEKVKSLHKIASGGELSRVMLAIKSVLLNKDRLSTLIFDEIDTGISGNTAGKVGIQLKNVSKSSQVICVTHLAQIAAMADCHLLIEKNTENGRTFTKVMPLSYEQRISEIARIMSGAELTENLYNSAKELVDRGILNENL